MKTILHLLAFLGAVTLFAGCSTPEARIQKNPELFNRLAPEQQNLIRAGKVAVGFDYDMVRLALGDPDRVTERTTAAGKAEVWQYLTYESNDGVLLYSGYYHRYWGDPYFPHYLLYTSYRVHSRMRVIFKNGKVAVTEENRHQLGR